MFPYMMFPMNQGGPTVGMPSLQPTARHGMGPCYTPQMHLDRMMVAANGAGTPGPQLFQQQQQVPGMMYYQPQPTGVMGASFIPASSVMPSAAFQAAGISQALSNLARSNQMMMPSNPPDASMQTTTPAPLMFSQMAPLAATATPTGLPQSSPTFARQTAPSSPDTKKRARLDVQYQNGTEIKKFLQQHSPPTKKFKKVKTEDMENVGETEMNHGVVPSSQMYRRRMSSLSGESDGLSHNNNSGSNGVHALILVSSQQQGVLWPKALKVKEGHHHEPSPSESAAVRSSSAKQNGIKSEATRWTPEEDDKLRAAVKKFNARNWKEIAKLVPGRDFTQCSQRWKKVLDPNVTKGQWSKEEDALLLSVVNKRQFKNWGHVAKLIPGRSAKQCRERYNGHLDPSLTKGNWTKKEDERLLEKLRELGPKWSAIARCMPGRTDNQVKARIKTLLRERERKDHQKRSGMTTMKHDAEKAMMSEALAS